MVEERGRGEGIPVGLCVLPNPPRHRGRSVDYPHYAQEIFSHAGLCYAAVSSEDLSEVLPALDVLITVGEAELPEALRRRLRHWVEQGGAWVAVGGVCGLPDLFGVDIQPPAYSAWNPGFSVLGEGYLEAVEQAHPMLAHLEIPLHFFNTFK